MNTRTIIKFFPFFILLVAVFSCNDDYLFLEKKPEHIGDKTLYQIIQNDGRFDTYFELLQHTDSAYIEILNRTGSRTLFIPTDEAFEQFFQENGYGIKSVNDMSKTMIRTFLSYYTLENAYVTSVLGSSEGSEGTPTAGNCLRRYTTLLTTDTIPYTNSYPNNPQFKRFEGRSIYLTTPGRWTLLNFTQAYFDKQFMKNEDFNTLYPGMSRQNKDINIFEAKVVEGDIVAINGYIHALDKVVLPPKNMYEEIRDMADVDIFRELLERFSEPVGDVAATNALWEKHPEVRDSVYYIDFFDTSDRVLIDRYGNPIKVEALPFSPAKNAEQVNAGTGQVPSNMPVIFCPTNQAMNDYLQSSYLRDYGDWNNVPDDIAAKFVRTHMKNSFIASYPTILGDAVDDVKGDLMYPLFDYSDDVKDATICRNGLVYTMNRVVAPRDFSTVVAPILNHPKARIVNWIINESYNNTALKFNYYLTSLDNRFTVFVPYDDAFLHYPDPIEQTDRVTQKRWLKFNYDESMKGVTYIYCNEQGDSIAAPAKPNFNNTNDQTLLRIQNRLKDEVDHYIIVGDIDENQTYVQTKGGSFIKITREGGKMRLQGAGNIEEGSYVDIEESFEDNNHIKNGKVYFVNNRIKHTLTSPIRYGMRHNECAKFFEMLTTYNDPDKVFYPEGRDVPNADPNKPPTHEATPFKKRMETTPKQPEYIAPIFSVLDGIDYAIPFLGTYDYTILIPTDEAIDKALKDGVFKSVDEIDAIEDFNTKVDEIKKVILFLKNHFVDGAIFTKQFYSSANAADYALPRTFTTSAKNPVTKDFYTLYIEKQGDALVIKKDQSGQEQAHTIAGTENTMTHQYRFVGNSIGSNSRVVIYQINNVLTNE